jgi:hypothetical protein
MKKLTFLLLGVIVFLSLSLVLVYIIYTRTANSQVNPQSNDANTDDSASYINHEITEVQAVADTEEIAEQTPDLGFVQVTSSELQEDDSRYANIVIPSYLKVGEQYVMKVTMYNTGTETWTKAKGYKLGSADPIDNTKWGSTRILLNESDQIKPGEGKDFVFVVVAPAQPGDYTMQWRMVREGVRWFGENTMPISIRVRADVEMAPFDNNDLAAKFISQKLPLNMKVGEKVDAEVTFKNTGTRTWTVNQMIRPGVQAPRDQVMFGTRSDKDSGSNRILPVLGETVVPGQTKKYKFKLTAPKTPGKYYLQFQMVEEFEAWFGDYSTLILIDVK